MLTIFKSLLKYRSDNVQKTGSLQEALEFVRTQDIHHTFVIGGAKLYAAVLQDNSADHILLTRITSPQFECDTFFPELDLNKWRRNDFKDLLDLTALDASSVEEHNEEKGTQWQYQLWSKVL